VAFDTETSGAYPVGYEICEIAGVKWKDGQIVEEFQTLVKPTRPMSDFVIGIHGITNEMVESAPTIEEVTPKFYRFLQGAVAVAHHAPFDLGFMSFEFEKQGLPLPKDPALCSSLISRKLFPESKNHKLQTLVEFFDLHKGTAHRALDDAKACLSVILKCFEKFGQEKTYEEILKLQQSNLDWQRYSIHFLEEQQRFQAIVLAIKNRRNLEISYRTGSDKREVKPIGLVRNPDGDYLVAFEGYEKQHKRYYLDKIVDAHVLSH
jgi:DNA polymerase-3 subunit epsilon